MQNPDLDLDRPLCNREIFQRAPCRAIDFSSRLNGTMNYKCYIFYLSL